MIKNMIFDMGNVLIDYNPRRFISQYVSDPADIELLLNAIFKSPNWQALDAGTTTDEQFAIDMLCLLPQRLHAMAKKLFSAWHTHYLPIPEATALVKRLKEKGYKLYLLSNASMRWFSYQYDYEAFSYFDGFLISANEHCVKPDRAIYERLFEMFHLKPEECFFTDDLPANIEGAKKCGMDGFALTHYQYDELISTLKAKNIL